MARYQYADFVVFVRQYLRVRLGKQETVISHFRRLPGYAQLELAL